MGMTVRRDVFQAIADPTRRAMLALLLGGPRTVGALAEQFDVTRQAVSLHAQLLEECDVIQISKHGRERVCALKPASLAHVSEWLEPFVKLWETRLDQLDELLTRQTDEEL